MQQIHIYKKNPASEGWLTSSVLHLKARIYFFHAVKSDANGQQRGCLTMMKSRPMTPAFCATVRRIAAAALLLAAAACDSGPKTYDDCMLQASRNSDNDRQFRAMAERCKDEFRDK